MKLPFDFDSQKNNKLINERDISFEEIIAAIENGDLLDLIENPNQKKYGHQKVFVVNIEDYIYLVPFVKTEDTIFLKTVFPSRKFTKLYLQNK